MLHQRAMNEKPLMTYEDSRAQESQKSGRMRQTEAGWEEEGGGRETNGETLSLWSQEGRGLACSSSTNGR